MNPSSPPFFPVTPKPPGTRVKLPKHPATFLAGGHSAFWYGTIKGNGDVLWDNNDVPDSWFHWTSVDNLFLA